MGSRKNIKSDFLKIHFRNYCSRGNIHWTFIERSWTFTNFGRSDLDVGTDHRSIT